jgi:tetratricopeptide (TPR) repeat protein
LLATQTEAETKTIAGTQGIPYICSPSLEPGCPAAYAFYSPEQDPRFPTRYIEAGQWQSYRSTALRDAANEEADEAEGQFVHYAASLTMLAVAVFLLGYSLTPQGRQRHRLYAVCAGGLVLVGGTWALVHALSPVSHPPDRAATAYANGRQALNTGDYPSAIQDFNTAISLRPHFVDAYVQRAQAELNAGIPHTGSGADALPTTAGPNTIASGAALSAAIRDDERAVEEGTSSPTLLSDLGKDLLYRGLLAHSAADLRESRSDLAESLRTFKSQQNSTYLTAGAKLRIAEDDLALRRPAAAAEYHQAEQALLAPDVPLEAALAPALTDLSLIESTRPALRGAVAAVRRELILTGDLAGTTLGGRPPSASAPTKPVQFTGVQAQPDPGHALWTLKNVGSLTDRDVLSVQWEYQDPLHGEWAVLPELSGPVGRNSLSALGSDGLASNNASYVSSSNPATCLPPGMFKVELYVNGQLAGSATAHSNWPALHAVRLNDVDGAMCVPTSWNALASKTGVDVYGAPKGIAGAAILDIPKGAVGTASAPELVYVMQKFLGGFAGSSGLFPGLTPAGKASSTLFFMSASNGQAQEWAYKGGFLFSGAGTAPNGQDYVGIAWGPNASEAQDVFYSLSPL